MLLFGLWYYELDRGGPVARALGDERYADFLFPQMSSEGAAHSPPGWKPRLVDYLYVSFTNATAFSPTDTMPLTANGQVADERPGARVAVDDRARRRARGQHPPPDRDALAAELEAEIRRVGTELTGAFPSTARHPMRALDARAMDLAARDRELRAALFRFVDVVPACRSLDDVARHLRGFLEELPDAPPPIAAAMRIADVRAARAALGAAAAAGVKHMAHRFIVGETPASAARRAARPVGPRRRQLGRPARRGDRHRSRGRPVRGALRRGARADRDGVGAVARAPDARA